MHYTTEPEAKLVRCTRGRIFDVAVDIRKDSPTFTRWCGFELDATGARALFIPTGIAHGFLTVEDDCDVVYQIDRIIASASIRACDGTTRQLPLLGPQDLM